MSDLVNNVWDGALPETISEEQPLPYTEGGAIVGIDLGTSNSCIAIWHLDKCRVKVERWGFLCVLTLTKQSKGVYEEPFHGSFSPCL